MEKLIHLRQVGRVINQSCQIAAFKSHNYISIAEKIKMYSSYLGRIRVGSCGLLVD